METKILKSINLIRRGSGANLNLFRYAAMVLVLLLGIGNAWANGGGSTTYYSKVSVSANPTGAGTVYVKAGSSFSGTNTSDTNNGTNKSQTYSIKATANTGYEFKSWSGSSVTITTATSASTTCTITASSETENNPTTGSATANFVKVFQFKAKADLATGSAGLGDVCVNFTNGTPAYQASAMTATTTQNGDDANTASKTKTAYFYAQKHTGAEFRGWYSDAAGTNKVSDNASYSANITSSVIAEPASPQLTYYAKFEKVETTPYWSLYGVAGTSKTLQIGETIDLVTETAGNTYSWGTPSYVDAGETNPVMTYNSSTKTFTANRAGTVTVTFTQAAGEDANGVLWKAGSETFTFTVNKLTPQFAWADPLPNFVVGTTLPVSSLFSFTPAESEQNWTLTSSDPTNLPGIAAPATGLSLPKEVNGVTLTFHQDATWKWNEIANTSIKINVTKEPVVFNWKNPSLIAGSTYSWTDFVETNSVGAWNLVSEDESVIPTMRSIASTTVAVAAGTVTLTFTQGQDLAHDAVPVQTKTFTVYPVDGLAQFKVGSTYYTDLNAANSAASSGSNKTIVCTRDGILPPGDYTISSGNTLLVPYNEAGTMVTEEGNFDQMNTTTYTAVSAYRTLTFAKGANLTVNGALYVAGQHLTTTGELKSTSGGPGRPVGPVGRIQMADGGHIELNGKLYCFGFITGQSMADGNNTRNVGTISANSGATVYENFIMGDMKGGGTTAAMVQKNTYHVFPFNSYFIQNIEVPLTINYGATEKCFTSMNPGDSNTTPVFTLIGTGNDIMFKLNGQGATVTKWYDPTTDHFCIKLSGNSSLANLKITASIVVTLTINSADFICPIPSSMHIILDDCNVALGSDLCLLPGSILEVRDNASMTVNSNMYLYDVDNWGAYCISNYYKVYNTPFTVNLARSQDDISQLDDAKLLIDGAFVVSSSGKLYSTANGANICGNHGGTISFPSSLPGSTNVYQVTGTGGDSSTGISVTYSVIIKSYTVYFSPISATAANLHNEDNSYTKSIENKIFYNIHGRWFVAADKDPKENHTYSFTYLNNGNAGTSVPTPAVYSSDKTGLKGGYKWVNVSLDNNFCGNKTYLGIDGHNYYYNSASTDAVSKWVQLVKLNDALYSGSDNNLYTFTAGNCSWASVGEIDENCMYTIEGVKKALVGTEFVALEKDEYDEVYVNVNNHSDYYMLFSGCVWQHATKIPDTYRAYEVLGNPYIWLNDEWTEVAEESPYYYTTDDQNIKHYYEFDNVTFSWRPAKETVRITTPAGDRKDFLTWDMAMQYLSQYTNPTVTLLEDAVASQSVATLAPGSKSTEFTFDLNGHTLTANIGSATYAIPSTNHACFMNMNTSAKLYITDNSDKANGQMLVYGVGNKNISCLRVTKGNVVMNGGRIYMENGFKYVNDANYKYVRAAGISLAAGQTLEINGGEIEAKTHIYAYGVYGESSAATATTSKITMNGGKVTGTAASTAYGILSYGIINMNGGTVEGKTEKVTTAASGTTAAGGSAYGIYANVSSNGTASNCYYATVNMTGGVVNATASTSTAHGISANAGQTIASSVSNYNPATNKASAKLNITGGTINAKCITSTTAYGVYAFGTENSNGSNASGAHIIKNCKITASATGTAYGVIMSASLHDLSGIALTGVAEIENADIYAETTSGSTAAAVYATATSNFMSRAKYNNGTAGVSAANKKLWFIDANNNDGDLTHEAIAVSGDGAKKTYRCKIGATGAGARITIKSGTFRAKSAYQYAYGAYANRSLCNYDGTVGSAEITIIDGTFSAETAAEYAYVLRNAGTMNVQGGTFNALSGTSTAYGVYAEAGTTTIDGGTFNIDATTTTAYGVCATGIVEGNTGWKHRGEIIINNGVFNARALGTTTAAGVYATGTYAELYQTKYDSRKDADKEYYYPVDEEGNKLADATKANYYPYRFGVHTIGGKVTVNGGTFNAKAFTTTAMGAYAYWSPAVRTDKIGWQGVARGEITIHDGEFNSETETSTTAEGVRSYGTVYVDGGTFNATSKGTTAYGVRVMDGTTTVDGGTFNVTAGTNTAIGVRTECSYSTTYGYCGTGEAIINGGTFNVNTWAGSTAYGVNVTGTTGAFSATSATGYTGTKPTDYAYASNATINGGTFIMNPSDGTSSYGIVVEATKTRGSETAYPKCEVNGGFFQMKGNSNSVYACGTSATEDAEGNPNLAIKGGHFSTNVNLSQSGTKNPVRTPYNIIACVHPEYKATYPHEVTEAYTITFKDDDDNTLWSGLQPKGSTAVYPLTNGIPEKTATATNSFEFASWDTPLAEVTGDATYIASFNTVAKKFMVTWKDDKGVEIDHMEYASGQTPTHADPDKEGYTFTGWTPAITAVGAADQVYTATFSINQYTIRWENEDGSLIREDKVNHGTMPTKPSNPTKEGYSFQAWNPGVVKATEDVTYTATYLLNLVTLTKANSTTATPYVTFALALTEANKADGGTLTLLQDVNVAGSAQSFTKTTTLDLNGHSLRGAVNKLINVNGSGKTVTAKDSKGGGMIEDVYATNGQLTAVYVTNGTFVLESGTIRVENPTTSPSASYYAAAVLVPSGKTFRMEGGTLESVVNVDYAYGVYNLGTTILNHGTINTYAPARSYGIRADNTTTINNDDVIINANATRTTYGVAVWNNVEGKTITINGGTFNGIATTTTGYAIHATTSTTEPTTFSTINVNGGKFKSTTKTVSNTGSATIHLNAGFYDTDTELAGYASPKQVVALTTEPEKAEGYNYKIVDEAHQVTFKNEDGSIVLQQSNIEDGVQPVYFGEAQTKASTPKYSYSFDGWVDASDGHVYAETELPVVSEDAVYTAHFVQQGVPYPITFANIDGMGTNHVQMVTYGEVPVYNGATPYMSGAVSNYAYTFIGWDPELAVVEGPATYTPRYNLVISHNVSFVINNVSATTPAALTVAEGAAVERPADQLVGCQHIAGWYTDGGLTEEWDFANDKLGESDLILYAKWETKTYTITWLDEFGDEIDQTTVDCGMVPAHADLYKPSTAAYSYDWKGWNKTIVAANADATYKSLGFTQVPKRYAITFVTGSGATVINPIEQEVGSAVVAPANPTREGYTFNGWIPAVPSVMPANNVECVAQWTVNTHKFAWNFDGGTPSGNYTETNNALAYGSTITYPTLSKTGYTFAGWSTSATSMPDADLTITANWTINTHELAWNFDGGTPSGSYTASGNAVAYGTVITYPTVTKNGYIFAGWSTDAASMPDADLTITASWNLAVARVTAGGNTTYHATVDDAITTATGKTNPTVTMLQDATTTEVTITDAMTINLNGKTITSTETTAEKAVFKINASGKTVTIGGTSGEINHTANCAGKLYGINIIAGTLEITGGTIYAENTCTSSGGSYRAYGINTQDNATEVKVSGGTIEAKRDNNSYAYGIYTNNACMLTMTGGTFKASGNATVRGIYVKGTTKLTNATITATGSGSYAVYVGGGATTINSGWFKGADKVLNGSATVKGGYYSNDADELEGKCATDYHVLPNSDANYPYKVAEAYTVTFKDGDNNTIQTDLVEKNQTPAYTGATTPTKTNTAEYTYTFTGWPTIVPVTAAATYTALFSSSKNSYEITWLNDDNSLINKTTVEYGVVPTHADATKTNTAEYTYTFTGWDNTPVAVTGEATYKATFSSSKKSYEITWLNDDNSLIDKTTVEYGVVPTHADATKAATAEYTYTFTGWDNTPVAVTGTATYKATFSSSKNSYEITWLNDDNSLIDKTMVEYGVVPTHADATKAATDRYTYTFIGWSPEVVAVEDVVTYTAQFEESEREYIITWQNPNNEPLVTTKNYFGGTPAYPTHEYHKLTYTDEENHLYRFIRWDPEIHEVNSDKNVYTAQYERIDNLVVTTEEPINVNTTVTTTTVRVEGKLNIASDKTLTTNDLILEGTPSSSGEIIGNVNATQHAYFHFSQPGGFKAKTWYAVAVPWQVDVPANTVGGVYIKKGDGAYVQQELGRTYDLIYYDGARRAAGANKAWNYVEDDQADHHMHYMMEPGRAYMIYLISDADTIRFERKKNAPLLTNSLSVYEYESSNPKNASWNGIANPATYHAYINAAVKDYLTETLNVGQVYNAETKTYTVVDMNANNLVVGQPIFVQATATNKSVIAYASHDDAFHVAPRRAKEWSTPLTRFEVELASNDEIVSDRIIIRMNEDKEKNEYMVGQDLVKMGVSSLVPQMWIDRYDSKMCINTVAPINNTADYPLSLFVPQAGEYTIRVAEENENADMLYLTRDDRIIWNLGYAPYTVTLERGTTDRYGLKLVHRIPEVATDIESMEAGSENSVQKILLNDKVYILRGGEMYSIDGQLVK